MGVAFKNIKTIFLSILVVCLLALAVFHTSCSKKIENHVEYIPEDAAGVLAFNFKQITYKVAWETITDMGVIEMLFEKFGKEDETPQNEGFEKLLGSPQTYGFDLLNQYYLFIGSVDQKEYAGAIIPLDNASKLKGQLQEDGGQLKKGKNIQYADFGEGIIGWKDGMAVYLISKDKEILVSQLEDIFKKKPTTLASGNENFRNLIGRSSDITIWGDMKRMAELNELNEENADVSMAGKVVDPEEFKNSYYNSALNFNDGEIKWDFSYHMNEQNLADYNQVAGQKFNPEIFSKIPAKNILAAGGGALNLNFLWNKMKEGNQDKTLSEYASLLNLDLDDFFTVLDGDIILTLNKLEPILPLPELVLGASVGSESKLDSLIEKYDGYLLDRGNYYTFNGGWGVNLVKNGKYIFIVRGEELTRKILSGKVSPNEALAPEHQSKITDNEFMLYIDIKQLTDGLAKSMLASKEIQKINTEIKDLELVASPLSGNVAKATLTIRFNKAGQNSLFTLLKMLLEGSEEEVAS